MERRAEGAVVAVWGPHPGGRLIYDASGRMAVQLMNPQRKPFAAPDRLAGTADEIRFSLPELDRHRLAKVLPACR